jgi:hypothetical protein
MAAGNWPSPLSDRRAKRMQRLDLRLWLRGFRIDGRVKHALDFSDDCQAMNPKKPAAEAINTATSAKAKNE